MYDWEDGKDFDGGDPEDGPVASPISHLSHEQVMRSWITKVSTGLAFVLVLGEVALAVTSASCGAQIAATGGASLFGGLMLSSAAFYFAAPA